ncbi:MAG: orotidine-5'-phosphate decarboxylase [Spirochaetes bacterium]|nr:orotidine-5'-phosphate decarboxylase [Spirochaetota bacterium]
MNQFIEKLNRAVQKNRSYLCVGLDTDYNKLMFKSHGIAGSIVRFNRRIIDVTNDLVCCYKINSAFYEAYGVQGIEALKRTIDHTKDIPVILDFKRSDIGSSARLYTQFGFDYLKADALTVIPYMGIDTIDIFREFKDRFVFVVAATSNPGSKDFQMFGNKNPLYLQVMKKCRSTDRFKNTGYVVGATFPAKIKQLREKGFNELFLIPGIGAQKGDINKSIRYAFLNKGRAIFNVSRMIIYQKEKKSYFKDVRQKALEYSGLFRLIK